MLAQCSRLCQYSIPTQWWFYSEANPQLTHMLVLNLELYLFLYWNSSNGKISEFSIFEMNTCFVPWIMRGAPPKILFFEWIFRRRHVRQKSTFYCLQLSGPIGSIRGGVSTDDRDFLLPASCPGYSPYPLADLLVVSLRALIALHRAISIPADSATGQTSAPNVLSSLWCPLKRTAFTV